jgi:uncharacterized protein (DUF1330 family)
MAVYVMIDVSLRSEAARSNYATYVEKVRPIVEKHGGRYLARGGKITPIAGGWNPQRVILIEFPSSDHVNQWWNSPEYRAIARLREDSTVARAILVDGCENAEPSSQ